MSSVLPLSLYLLIVWDSHLIGEIAWAETHDGVHGYEEEQPQRTNNDEQAWKRMTHRMTPEKRKYSAPNQCEATNVREERLY
mmetsp:Transcript_4243/g.11066  ORF Transcript_4243/g.11066 Transcript_4243/m.11066 type:complete len:82 (-) Transcript_4243:337-582(-)